MHFRTPIQVADVNASVQACKPLFTSLKAKIQVLEQKLPSANKQPGPEEKVSPATPQQLSDLFDDLFKTEWDQLRKHIKARKDQNISADNLSSYSTSNIPAGRVVLMRAELSKDLLQQQADYKQCREKVGTLQDEVLEIYNSQAGVQKYLARQKVVAAKKQAKLDAGQGVRLIPNRPQVVVSVGQNGGGLVYSAPGGPVDGPNRKPQRKAYNFDCFAGCSQEIKDLVLEKVTIFKSPEAKELLQENFLMANLATMDIYIDILKLHTSTIKTLDQMKINADSARNLLKNVKDKLERLEQKLPKEEKMLPSETPQSLKRDVDELSTQDWASLVAHMTDRDVKKMTVAYLPTSAKDFIAISIANACAISEMEEGIENRTETEQAEFAKVKEKQSKIRERLDRGFHAYEQLLIDLPQQTTEYESYSLRLTAVQNKIRELLQAQLPQGLVKISSIAGKAEVKGSSLQQNPALPREGCCVIS